jgi:hypothetical protein
MSVRLAAIAPRERADRRGGNPGEALAHSGCLRTAVGRAEQIALEACESDAVSGRGTRGRQCPRPTSVNASASMTATSLPGTTGEPFGVDEPGQIVAQRAQQHELGAAARAARRWSRAGCRLAPPGLTIVFLIGMPPKQTNSSVCRSSTDHAVARSRNSRIDPTTCGMITDCAPLL